MLVINTDNNTVVSNTTPVFDGERIEFVLIDNNVPAVEYAEPNKVPSTQGTRTMKHEPPTADTPELSYRELQSKLKAARAMGVALTCKLNATKDVLIHEWARVQSLNVATYTPEPTTAATTQTTKIEVEVKSASNLGYRELQAKLKERRDEDNIHLQCKLNAKKEVLEAEWNRVKDLPAEKSPAPTLNMKRSKTSSVPPVVTNCDLELHSDEMKAAALEVAAAIETRNAARRKAETELLPLPPKGDNPTIGEQRRRSRILARRLTGGERFQQNVKFPLHQAGKEVASILKAA